MLDLFPDVTVDHEGHIVILVMLMVGLLLFLIVVERHHSDQVKCLLLRFLNRHRRIVFPEARVVEPTPMHDCGPGIRSHRIVGSLEHKDTKIDSRLNALHTGRGF